MRALDSNCSFWLFLPSSSLPFAYRAWAAARDPRFPQEFPQEAKPCLMRPPEPVVSAREKGRWVGRSDHGSVHGVHGPALHLKGVTNSNIMGW